MWELDCEEGWAPKNWCFWTVVLEKTLESPLDCKEIHPVHSEDQPWDFFGRNDAKLKLQYFGHLMWRVDSLEKTLMLGGIWGQEENGMTEDEMAGWRHWLNGQESEWTLGVGDGQGGLACCDSWGCKKSDTTEQLNWTRLVITFLPRSKHLLISWLQSPSAVTLEPPKIKSDTVSTVSPSISHEVIDGTRFHDLRFLILRYKPIFSLSSRGFLAPLHFLP